MAENDEKQRLQQTDSISSDSTVAPGGHENKAYDPDDSGSSLASSPSPIIGSKKEAGGSDIAVNMEMADLTPPQQPKIIGNDKIHPKDFYVSVNEHKKGIRSEKLYVTKDNRETQRNNCRTVVCISVVVLFLAAAIAVATLIGVGVIDPMQRNVATSTSVAQGIKDGRSREIDENIPITEGVIGKSATTQDNSLNKPFEEILEAPLWAVPNAYEGNFKITNLAWDDRLANVESEMFKDLAGKLEIGLEEAMITNNMREDGVFHIKITHFESGSVVVNYRLSWMAKNDPTYAVSRDALMRQFSRELNFEDNILAGIYLIDDQSLALRYLDDDCREMMCGGSCRYDYVYNEFSCTCPENTYLNDDGSSCVLFEENGYTINTKEATASTTTTTEIPSTTTTTTEPTASAEPTFTTTEITTTTTESTTTTEMIITSAETTTEIPATIILAEIVATSEIPETTTAEEEPVITTEKVADIFIAPTVVTTTEEAIELEETTIVPEMAIEARTESFEEEAELFEEVTEPEIFEKVTTEPEIIEEVTEPTVEEESSSIMPSTSTISSPSTTPLAEKEIEQTTAPISYEEEEESATSNATIVNNDDLVEEVDDSSSNNLDIAEEPTTEEAYVETTEELAPVTSTSFIDISIPMNLTDDKTTEELEDHLESLISKIVTEMTTIKPEDEEETTQPIIISTEELVEEDSLESTTFKVKIPTIPADLDAEELEEKLKELVASVTEQLEEGSTELIGEIDDSTTPIIKNEVETTTTADFTTTTSRISGVLPRRLDIDSNESSNSVSPKCSSSAQFQCGNGDCIERTQRCDTIFDCVDSSDEKNCELITCPADWHECSGMPGMCIPSSQTCDGFVDCLQGDDEANCSIDKCQGADQYFCSADSRCIQTTQLCNGIDDCSSGQDELNCECTEGQFQCTLGGGCIMSSKVCDGQFDCPDQSDEWNCFISSENGALRARLQANLYGPVCASSWTDEWSDQVCLQMNTLGLNEDSPYNTSLDSSEFFLLNSSLSVDDVLFTQAARSYYQESCEEAVNFNCLSFECGKWPLSHNLTSKLAGEAVSSEDLTEERWPSLAYMIHVKDKSTCTASIIGPRWLITAYSCLLQSDFDPFNWAVVGGPGGSFGPERTQIKAVNRIVRHPQSSKIRGFSHNDIALVELTESFTFDEFVQPICIGNKEPSQGDMCITAGWSDGQTQGVSFYQYLEHVPVPYVERDECNSTAHYNGHLSSTDLCTGSRVDSPSCKSDNGAPLMCLDADGSWKLTGTLSREGECLSRSHPDVFSSIVALGDWISKTTGRRPY